MSLLRRRRERPAPETAPAAGGPPPAPPGWSTPPGHLAPTDSYEAPPATPPPNGPPPVWQAPLSAPPPAIAETPAPAPPAWLPEPAPGPEVPGPEVPGPEVPGPEVPGPEVPGPGAFDPGASGVAAAAPAPPATTPAAATEPATEPAGAVASLPEDWAALLRTMIVVRSFDDEVGSALAEHRPGRLPDGRCSEPLVAVLGSLLRAGDTVVSAAPAYLSVLASGAPLAATLAELLGAPQGLGGGRGAADRIADAERGAIGLDRPLVRTLLLATGTALAAQCLQNGAVTVAVLGGESGSAELAPGSAGEAALRATWPWRLPLVVVTASEPGGQGRAAPGTPLPPPLRVDGGDVLALRSVLAQAVGQARAGGGLVLVDTTPAAPPAAPAGAATTLPSDPILRLALLVLRAGVARPDALDQLRDRSRAEVRAARELVRSWLQEPLAAGAGQPDRSTTAEPVTGP